MLSFNAQLDLVFEDVNFTKTMDRVLGQIFRESVRDWLRELLLHVPVETGMAKAALQPLGRFLRVAVDIKPTRAPYYSKLEGMMQNIQSGTEMQMFELVDNKTNPMTLVYSFTFILDIWHYWHRRYYNGKHLPGEDAWQLAEAAFYQAFMDRAARRLPGLDGFLVWRK